MQYYNNTIAGNDKLEFILVSMDDDKKKALGWATKAKHPWLTVLSSKARSSGLGKFESGAGSYALIDKNGRLLETEEAKIKAKIKEVSK